MTMKFLFLIICLSMPLGFLSCQTAEKESIENIELRPTVVETISSHACKYSDENDRLKDELFPFSYEKYDTKNILKYFAEGTTVDSSKLEYPGEEAQYRIYKFHKNESFISFQVKPKNNWFYLHKCSINNDLLNFKNRIKIGMNKKEVSTILDVKTSDCDTIEFDLGELSTYYEFVFRNEKLARINIISTE